jgi:hypothetical protein
LSKNIARPPHKSTQPPHRNPYWSEDGHWRWDGAQWVTNLSEDGHWRWDGAQWVTNLPPPPPAEKKGLNPVSKVVISLALIVLVGVLIAFVVYNTSMSPSENQGVTSGEASYLHYSCGASKQCAQATGAKSDIRGKYPNEDACWAAGPQTGMVHQPKSGEAGWFCSPSSNPNDEGP